MVHAFKVVKMLNSLVFHLLAMFCPPPYFDPSMQSARGGEGLPAWQDGCHSCPSLLITCEGCLSYSCAPSTNQQ